jgi:thiol-disulfide isomerase/thioredoxin
MTGRRLDGAEDSLSAYRGRVVLIDFWATWCRPCVDVLPELRELVAELPADRFTLLAISVDEQLETVTAFREREPMPWTNWHAGIDSDIERAWDVRGFPTYILVDEQGLILARSNGFNDFAAMLEEAVEGGSDSPIRDAVGTPDPPNPAELLDAAEQGDPEAQVRLGDLYQRGDGVPENDAEAVAWYLRAAGQGYADAQFRLGFVYSNGEGVSPDEVESLGWFRRAAEQGYADAQFPFSGPSTATARAFPWTMPSPSPRSVARPSRDMTPRSGCSAPCTSGGAAACRGTRLRRTCGCIWPCRRTTSTIAAPSTGWRSG